MCRLKWFYHPYTFTPQNDRLDEKTQKTTFVSSVYAHFEELAGVLSSFPTSVHDNGEESCTRCYALIKRTL